LVGCFFTVGSVRPEVGCARLISPDANSDRDDMVLR